MKKKAFTAIEVMVVAIVMAVLSIALYTVFSRAQFNAVEIISNQKINDDIDIVLMKMTDDIREANKIVKDEPKFILPAEIFGLQTSAESKLSFYKYDYDFTKDPSTLSQDEHNYVKSKVSYFVEEDSENGLWSLYRELLPYDSRGEEIPADSSIVKVLSGIKECVFYRLDTPASSGGGCVYIRLKLVRNDAADPEKKYYNEMTIAVKERGADPE